MTQRIIRKKPKKPYPTFPLTPHPNGQWCKKIRGKVHFFGVWEDRESAHKRYLNTADNIHAGIENKPHDSQHDRLTLKLAANQFLKWQYSKIASKEIGPRWFEDCRRILLHFSTSLGKEADVLRLTPADFQRYKAEVGKRLGVHGMTRTITAIRSMFKYLYENDYLDNPMKFGAGFSKPTAAQRRKERFQNETTHGKRHFVTDEIRQILQKCDEFLKGPVLLGLNGGMGNTDCATLPQNAVDLEAGVIAFARPKTGVERVVPLWPETIIALQRYIELRPKAEDSVHDGLFFLTPTGKPLVRQRFIGVEDTLRVGSTDSLVKSFAELTNQIGIQRKGAGFYALRHTFRTLADEVKDQHAIFRIMGHSLPGMAGIYVETISMERLRAVTDHVRQKLFSCQ